MPNADTTRPSRLASIWLGIKQTLGLACVLVLFALIGLICVDVVARYVFNRPVAGAYELTELMLATLIFLALPLTTQAREHIEVELLEGVRNRAFRSFSALAATAATALVFVTIAYQIWHHALRLQRYGQVTDSLEIPIYLIGFLGAASCLLSALVLFVPHRTPSSQDRQRD